MNYTHKEVLSKLSTLTLYRLLVKNLRFYPSKNRFQVLLAVKEEFRDHVDLPKDSRECKQERKKAEVGLAHVMLYKSKADEMRENYSVKAEVHESLNPRGEDFIYF